MTSILIIVACVILVPYILGPIAVKFSLKLRARPTLQPLGVDALPPEVYEFFGWTAPALGACGFKVAAYLAVPDQVPNVTAYVALWLNRSTGQAATAVVLYGKTGIKVNVKRYTEFLTKPVPGPAVLTNNTPELQAFKIDPRVKDVISLPKVQDIATLYQVHLCREARLIRMDSPRYLPPVGKEIEYMADAVAHEIEQQVGTGFLFNESGDLYRPTWRGALVMTLGQLFPIKQFRKSALNRRAAHELAQMRPMPFPSKVRITEQSPYGSTRSNP